MKIDPVSLTADLVRCPSVTPEEGGAIDLLEQLLEKNGFSCTRIVRGQVSNLFAKWGTGKNGRVFGFNGHTDVVPVGDLSSWTVDPFGAEIKEGYLYGRGATDMKSGVAAFVASAIDFVNNKPPDGSIVITITGDEEGDNFSFETAAKDNNDGGPPSGGEFILAISPDKTAGTNWQKHADEFFDKMKSMGEVRLPGERRHKNRLDKGPRNINEELVNKIKSLS